jgi:hypothetical protein
MSGSKNKKRSIEDSTIDSKRPRQTLPGAVFIYKSDSTDIIEINDEMIEMIDLPCVQSLLTSVRDRINAYENAFHQTSDLKPNPVSGSNDQLFLDQIETVDDLTYKCVNIARWRRGFGFVFLQLSLKNKGMARTTVFVTNTVHHSAVSFGTTPGAEQAQQLLDEYLNNNEKVLADINDLKQYHLTNKTSRVLLKNMQK